MPSVGISSFAGALCTLFAEVWLRGSMAVALLWVVEGGWYAGREVNGSPRQQQHAQTAHRGRVWEAEEEERWQTKVGVGTYTLVSQRLPSSNYDGGAQVARWLAGRCDWHCPAAHWLGLSSVRGPVG